MIKKFPARKTESNLEDVYELLLEIKNGLKVTEAKIPYNSLLSSSLELSIKKISILENRLAAESFIDGLYISEVIAYLIGVDPSLTTFSVKIKKVDSGDTTFSPYKLEVIGN
jgi:hypothetical protein